MMKLLIVDDEENTRIGLRDFVPWSELGIDAISVAGEGYAALDLFSREDPDIILCDVRMPRMNGIEFARRAKMMKPGCKLIFLSGFSDKEYLKAAIKLGATDYIEKPVIMNELKSVIEQAVKQLDEERVSEKPETGPINDWQDPASRKDPADIKIHKLEAYVEKHYGDKGLSIQRISQHLDLSLNYTCGLFKKKTGRTINDYIISLRVRKARDMLKDRDIRIYEIADRAGFRNANYFARIFKKKTGFSPSEYREKFVP